MYKCTECESNLIKLARTKKQQQPLCLLPIYHNTSIYFSSGIYSGELDVLLIPRHLTAVGEVNMAC